MLKTVAYIPRHFFPAWVVKDPMKKTLWEGSPRHSGLWKGRRMEEDDWNPEGLAEKVIHVDWWTSAVLWIWSCSHLKAEGYRLQMYYIYIHIHICTHNLVIGAVELPSLFCTWPRWRSFPFPKRPRQRKSPENQQFGPFLAHFQGHRKKSINQAPYQKKYEAASKTYEEVPLAFWMGSSCVWSFHDL